MNKISQFVFKPSKKIIFSSNEKNKLIEYQPYKLRSIPKSQKLFSTINPVKPFNRFTKPKISNTGVDPLQTFIDFINKDFPKPYKSQFSPLSINNKSLNVENTKWIVGTTCNCRRKEFLPKLDPYKEYHFISNDENKKISNLKMTYLSTDNISIKTPEMLKTIEAKKSDNYKSILKLKELNFNYESNSYWVPFSRQEDNNYNKSSVNYNIINYKDNKISGKREPTILEKSFNNKKKGITEYYELRKSCGPNFRPNYAQMFTDNNKRFMKIKGAFTHLYDSYNKNGNVYQPFSTSNSNEQLFNKRNKLNLII